MAVNAEQLNIILSAKTADLTKQLKSAENKVARFSKKSNASLGKTGQAFSGLAKSAAAFLPALGAAAVISKVKSVVAELDEIGKTADRIGITTDALQLLRVTAESAGVAQASLDASIEKLGKGLAEAAMGIGTAKDALKVLGLNAQDLIALGLDGAMGKIADEVNKLPSAMEKTAIATQLFGRSGAPMLNLLREGSEGMAQMQKDARALGVVIDENLIRSAEDAQTQLDLMSRVINAELSSALISLAPFLVSAATGIAGLASVARDFLTIFPQGGMLPELLDAEGVRALADEMGGLSAELVAVERARSALSANEEMFGVDSKQALSWAGDLEAAEKNLASAVAQRKAEQSANENYETNAAAFAETINNLNREAELVGMSAEAAERKRIATERQAREQALLNDLMASGREVTDQNLDGVAALGQLYEDAALSASKILNPVKAVGAAARAVVEPTQTAAEALEEMLTKMIEASPALKTLGFDAEALTTVMGSVQSSMESAFMGMVDGTMSAKDAFKTMASDIIKELYRVLVVQRLVGSFEAGSGGILGAAFTALGGKASGGSVMAGQAYTVGEHGREPFIPSQNGRILSTAQAKSAMSGGGGGGVTIVQNNTFGNGVNRAEINAMLPKIVEASKAAVLDARRRGGSYAGAF